MSEHGSIFNHHGLTVYHAHEGTAEYDEAYRAVRDNNRIIQAVPYLVHLPLDHRLQGLYGEKILEKPEEVVQQDNFHDGAKNFAFRPHISV